MNDEMKPDQEISQAPAAQFSPVSASAENGGKMTGGDGLNPWRPWLAIVAVAALALALSVWQWMETRTRLAETRQEMAERLSVADQTAGESAAQAKQAQAQLAVLQSRLGELEARMSESKSQQKLLESLFQNLSRGNDESALTEVEQSVTLASQQLQIAGNVRGAINALQVANARLAGDGEPLASSDLRTALMLDLDRLRALPDVDLPGIYLRLENVISAIDALPLAAASKIPDDGASASPHSSAARPSFFSMEYWQRLLTAEYWQGVGASVWNEMRSIMRVQHVNRAEPVLLPPGQDFFLRENLKLRLLDARLALFSRNQEIFRKELLQCVAWIERYFDGNDKSAQNSLNTLKQLAATEIVIAPSSLNLNGSLSAIKRFRARRE